MGITVFYQAPAAAGTAFTYSVERRKDGKIFDFTLNAFVSPGEFPASAASAPLAYCEERGAMTAEFDHVEDRGEYIIRILRTGRDSGLLVELPLTVRHNAGGTSVKEGRHVAEPSYRAGKKFVDGKAIDARHRLTCYADDDGDTVYTATLWEDGTSSCNCPEWGPKRRDGRRMCKHSLRAMHLTEDLDLTGDQPRPAPAPEPPATAPFRRRSRTVDT